ncbi:hypothetical protein EJ03DRAFT_343676 [Teratosphaeria nubilosa]|uniref:GRF-type domain-containing protein n=1 Tax=Teratosphaeria nubilosa TaxID=161662 RepID=A0A6G1L9J9_9PEZI|nr:hypothetical protein EJ03DRAFT_343676 [Teratosphaeria nubilosa]
MFRGGRSRGYGGGGSRGRGNVKSNGHSSVRLNKGLFADGIWQCNCSPRLPAEHFKVKKEGLNKGRWFYTCQNQPPKRCDFFLWDEDAKPREEAAVLSNSRSEPLSSSRAGVEVQEGWNAGRAQHTPTPGKGLFSGPSPTVTRSAPPNSSAKRKAQDADLSDDDDDEQFPWPLTGQEEQELAKIADSTVRETPHKALKTGVYATPATTGRRKLPWLEQPRTPATASKPLADYFATPSKASAAVVPTTTFGGSVDSIETPKAQEDVSSAAARTPSPPTRHKDALFNPADSASTLTSEALAALSTTNVPTDIISKLRSILSKHDLKTQGILKGRDISRLALKAKDAKIAELQAKIASMEADREVDKGVIRQLKWQAEHAQESQDEL